MTERAIFDWHLFTPVWEEFVEYAEDRYGETAEEDGYLARLLERAMREPLQNNRHAELENKIHELVEAAGVKKTDLNEEPDTFEFDPDHYYDKTRVVKQVDATVLRKWKRHADEFSGETYGEHLSRHLKLFLWGGQPRKLTERVDRVLEEIERDQDTSLSTPERIADRLDESFSREEFLEAASAEGVTTERYALREHLPAVLDETRTYPHPNNSDQFIPEDSDTIPEMPDPSTLPYQAMDDAEKQLVIKAAAVRRLNDCQGQGGVKFDINDAVTALDGRPKHATARALLQAIADDHPENGFRFDSNAGELRYSREAVLDSTEVNHDALTIALGEPTAKTDAEGGGSAPESTRADEGTVERPSDAIIAAAADRFAADDLEDLPSVVLRTALAKEKHPDQVDDETGTISEELKERVTPAEIERVREHGPDDAGEELDIDDELETLTGEATAVRADGGRAPPDRGG